MIRRLSACALLLALAFLAMPVLSRPPAEDEEKPLGKLPSDLALVPRDALYFISVRPGDVAALPCFKAATLLPPLERAIDFMKETWGFGPEGLERVTVFARRLGLNNPNLAVFRTKKAYDKDALKKAMRLDKSVVVHGKTVAFNDGWRWGPSLWLADDDTFVVAQAEALVPYLATLAKPGKTHPLADELKVADGSHSLTAAALPSLLFRSTEAMIRLQEESWRKPRTPIKKDGPPRNIPKDGKEKFGGLPRASRFVSYQPGGFREDVRIEDLADPAIKLKGMEDAFESMEQSRMGVEMMAVSRSVLRARRALATLDIARAGELTLSLKAEFLNEADARDGEVMADFGRITAREALTPSARMRRESKAVAELLKPVAEGFADAVVKRDGKTVSTVVKAKPDIAAVAKAVIEGGPGMFGGGSAPPRPAPKTAPPKFEPKDK